MEIIIITLLILNIWVNNLNHSIICKNQAFILEKIEELKKEIKPKN
jgi:hypothetical protein